MLTFLLIYVMRNKELNFGEAGLNICLVDGCGKKRVGFGFCSMHYRRFLRYGDPNQVLDTKKSFRYMEEWLSIESDDCFTWPFYTHKGYAKIKIDGKPLYCHQIACERANGPKPFEKAVVRHLCGNGHEGCFNPKHVVWGTYQENSDDRVLMGRSPKGEAHGRSKVSSEQVLEILERIKSGERKTTIARSLEISEAVIYGITTGSSWSWLTGIPKRTQERKRAA